MRNQETAMYAPPETGCDFEGSCGWKWRNELDGGFRIGVASNETGPPGDADGERNGEPSHIICYQ